MDKIFFFLSNLRPFWFIILLFLCIFWKVASFRVFFYAAIKKGSNGMEWNIEAMWSEKAMCL